MTLAPCQRVASITIKFLKEIFKENFLKDNWHLDPDTEMYIRQEYPSDPKESGIKPGVVVDELGGLQRGVEHLGEVGYIAMHQDWLSEARGNDNVWSGRFSLKAISTVEDEAEDIAYKVALSIMNFVDFLIGQNGLIHIDCNRYTEIKPFRQRSNYKLWASDIMFEFALNTRFSRRTIDRTPLEGIDWELLDETPELTSQAGVVLTQHFDKVAEDIASGIDLTTATNLTAEDIIDLGTKIIPLYDKAISQSLEPGLEIIQSFNQERVWIEPGLEIIQLTDLEFQENFDPKVVVEQKGNYYNLKHYDPGVFIEFEIDEDDGGVILPPTQHHSELTEESIIVEGRLEDIYVDGEVDLAIPFVNKGVISTIYIEPESDGAYTIQLFESSKREQLIYSNRHEGIGYDVLDVIYISQESHDDYYSLKEDVYITIRATNINFKTIRLRGIKL